MDRNIAIALNRFGLGARPDSGDLHDPKAWLLEQISADDPLADRAKTGTLDALAAVNALREVEEKIRQTINKPDAGTTTTGPNPIRELAKSAVWDYMAEAVVTVTPFRERLVWFWANHFTIAHRSQVTSACSGPFIREAIRPFVNGKFSDMLMAVMRHPAMLSYLNQENSAGPDSPAGIKRHLGLNENLARECLELHTVSPKAGYTQADVTAFAGILTGWSIELRTEPRGFRFRPALHEPGEIRVMGKTWAEGEQGGDDILSWLGTHPSTYRHIAEKMVRHFVSDDPPIADVHTLELVLRRTKGDLGAAAACIVNLPSSWSPFTKLRTPQEYVTACYRASGAGRDAGQAMASLAAGLGQGVFQAPFPIGWPDRAADWAGPEALIQRVDFAYGLAGKFSGSDPAEIADTCLGPLLSAGTLAQIRGAGSRRDGITVLFSSPEFQRR
jgi:uncharacterized protein (DUF1800 family)